MRSLAIVLLATLGGCIQTYDVPSCGEVSRTELEMDEATPEGTPSELLALVEIDGLFAGTTWDGGPVEVEVFVAQDGAPAWVEQEVLTERTREFGFSRESALFNVSCMNQMQIPILAEVQTPTGDVDVILSGTSHIGAPQGINLHSPGVPWVVLEGDFSDDAFLTSDYNPSDYDEKTNFIELDFDDAGFRSGSAGWKGQWRDIDGKTKSMTDRVVTFDPETTDPDPSGS